ANPALRGKPIAVVGSGHRTVITTSSYEARKFGVKTGMAVWEGKRCCPDLITVVGDNRKYQHTSTRIVEIFRDYTPEVEVFSIDEAWIDVTGSIGIAPNKLLAKLASEMQKPDGLTIIRPEDVERIIERMPVGDLCGIGRKTARQLKLMGINSCGELGRCDEGRLTRRFGIIGQRLKLMGQ